MAQRFSWRIVFRTPSVHLVVTGLWLVCLGACSPSNDGSTKGVARPRPDAEMPVRIALHGDPASLDPHLQSEVIAQAVLGNVYDALVSFDADMRLVPQLAKTWSNPDELTWRFELRDDLSFHDGRRVTSADVVASLERVRNHPLSRQSASLVAVDEIVALDEWTVELRTLHPYVVLLNKLAYLYVVPADAPEEITVPLGSGPYRFAERLPARSADAPASLRLDLVSDDPRAAGLPRKVEYYFVSHRKERLAGLLASRYDIIDDLGLSDLGEVQGRDDVRIESRSSLLVAYLQLDPNQPPFDDPRVRRAVSLAIDREDLVRRMFGDYAEPAGQMVSQNVFGYSPELRPPRRDLAAAKLLLADAGYDDGLRVTLEHRDGRAVAVPLRDQLAEAGIQVELSPRPWSELYGLLQTGELGFYLGGWVCTSADAGDLFDAKVHSREEGSGYGRANYANYSNPELDALVEDANQTASVEQRGELWRRGLEILADDLPYVPLFSQHEVYGVRDRVGWRPRQDGRVYGRDIHLSAASPGGREPRQR